MLERKSARFQICSPDLRQLKTVLATFQKERSGPEKSKKKGTGGTNYHMPHRHYLTASRTEPALPCYKSLLPLPCVQWQCGSLDAVIYKFRSHVRRERAVAKRDTAELTRNPERSQRGSGRGEALALGKRKRRDLGPLRPGCRRSNQKGRNGDVGGKIPEV
jgi:hypothetical protein